MATHSSILAWKIPWTEEPGRLQFVGSQRVGHNWATNPSTVLKVDESIILSYGYISRQQGTWQACEGISMQRVDSSNNKFTPSLVQEFPGKHTEIGRSTVSCFGEWECAI